MGEGTVRTGFSGGVTFDPGVAGLFGEVPAGQDPAKAKRIIAMVAP